MKVLVINAGSSSLKYQLVETDNGEVLAKGLAERIGLDHAKLTHEPLGKNKITEVLSMKNHREAIQHVITVLTDAENGIIKDMSEIKAVGHRVVHGGETFTTSALITEEVKDAIRGNFDLAPLHNPPNMTGIEACEAAMPNVPMVAVFDTAFHQSMPPEAFMYALPYEFYKQDGIRRYGFHGTSHMFVSQRAAELLDKPLESLRLITCHLGNGSSITAVKQGKSVDTSMGMTPLAGICMGTRCGDIDPAIVTFLMDNKDLTTTEVNNLMNKRSGVAGISGVSSDFRDLKTAKDQGNVQAALALDMFVYQARKLIGAYAAAMGGLDGIVFTAGIGENSDWIRSNICKGLEFLGVEIDDSLNNGTRVERIISKADAKVKVMVVPTDEELMIVQETCRVAGLE